MSVASGCHLIEIVDRPAVDSQVGGAVLVAGERLDGRLLVPLPIVVELRAFIEQGELETVLLGSGENPLVDVLVSPEVGAPPIDQERVDAGRLRQPDVPLGDLRIGAVVKPASG